jgi:hypothetical protein
VTALAPAGVAAVQVVAGDPQPGTGGQHVTRPVSAAGTFMGPVQRRGPSCHQAVIGGYGWSGSSVQRSSRPFFHG